MRVVPVRWLCDKTKIQTDVIIIIINDYKSVAAAPKTNSEWNLLPVCRFLAHKQSGTEHFMNRDQQIYRPCSHTVPYSTSAEILKCKGYLMPSFSVCFHSHTRDFSTRFKLHFLIKLPLNSAFPARRGTNPSTESYTLPERQEHGRGLPYLPIQLFFWDWEYAFRDLFGTFIQTHYCTL